MTILLTIIKLLKVNISFFHEKNHILKMHVLQPKHTKLKPEEVEKLLKDLNISLAQIPKIKINDPALPDKCEVSDVLRIERIVDNKKVIYYRVVAV